MGIKKVTRKKLTKKEKEINQEILKDIEKKESKGVVGSFAENMYSSPIDLFKWGICKEIVSLKTGKGFTSKKMSELMGADKSKASLVLNYRVDSFSIERLMGYLIALRGVEKKTDKKIFELMHLFDSEKAS